MRWTVKTGEDMRSGLTLAQLETLVATGALRADDALRAETGGATSKPRWLRVDEMPYLRRALRSTTSVGRTGAITGPLTDEAIATFLSIDSDVPRMQRIRRLAAVVRIAAASLLALEVWLLIKLLLTGT